MDPILTAGYLGQISLAIVDYPNDVEQQSTAADSNGNASIVLDPVPQGFIWRIERMTTFVSDNEGNLLQTPSGALFGVYKVDGGATTAMPVKFRDGSQSPGLDVADESSPITVQQGLSVLFAWTGLTPETYGNVTMQYQLIRRLVGVTSG